MILIKQEAGQKARDANKVIDIRDRLPGLEGLLQTGLVRKEKTFKRQHLNQKLIQN